VLVNPSWSKGYARKGAALHGARRYDEAISAYEEGLTLEDSPALRKGLKEVQDAKGLPLSQFRDATPMADVSSAIDDKEELGGFAKMFSDPNLFGKLAANPRTQKHLADPGFVQKAGIHVLLLCVTSNPIFAAQHDPKEPCLGRLVRK
jgi:stress-induced-phosphoprotein 1